MPSIIINTTDELRALALVILSSYPGKKIYCLEGRLGAGKTTAIKYFCEQLKVTDMVNSPTYSIVNEYNTSDGNPVYHFDFYRLKNISELLDIGYEEYFYGGSYCFIEWPEKFAELLPGDYVYIKIYDTGVEGARMVEYFSSNEDK